MNQPRNKLSRRTMVGGAAGIGAFAAAASLLRSETVASDAPAPGATPPAGGGGYRLTEHVKRYYQTTLL